VGTEEGTASGENKTSNQDVIEPVPWGWVFNVLYSLNRLVCRLFYHIVPSTPSPLPRPGSALLVCNHSSYSDAMVVLATAGRPVVFVVTRDVYDLPHVRWVLHAARCIPVRRGAIDIGAARQMFRTLEAGEVLGIFPQGGIDESRLESGYPGVGYLALKTGVLVIPMSITWQEPRPQTLLRSVFTPGHAIVRYGAPFTFERNPDPSHEEIRDATDRIMAAIDDSRRNN
jgi:1-acyl-sn-glycerol-3-phosphate acyltransferase